MTSRELVKNIFSGKGADSIPVFDIFHKKLMPGEINDINLVYPPDCRRDFIKGKFNMLAVSGPFQGMCETAGLENVLGQIGQDPGEAVKRMHEGLEKTVDSVVLLLEKEPEIDGVWVWEDMAYSKGPYFSPDFYRRNIFEMHKRLCGIAANRGLPVVFHSDGNVNDVIPMLVKAGFSGIHPLESRSGMSAQRLSERWNDSLVLFGNISADVLEQTDMRVIKDMIKNKLDTLAGLRARYVFGFESPVGDGAVFSRYLEILEFVRGIITHVK